MSKHLSRRTFLKSTGVALTGALLAACAPVAPSADGGAAAAAVDLEIWTFVNTHARWFRSMGEDYQAEVDFDFNLDVSEIAYTDMHDKVQIALQTGGVGAPDIADLEQGRFGGFLRGADPGLLDIKDRLSEGGYLEDLVLNREALYSYQGKIYGVEHALTPVVQYYRADVFESAGVDMDALVTWDDFIAAGQAVSTDDVKAISFSAPAELYVRQRGFDYFDADGNITLDSDICIDTMDWLLALRDVHGIANQQPAGDAWWAAINEGKYLTQTGADWYAGFFKDNAPDLSGKWKARPLPVWEEGGSQTSCYGGTGACIVQTSDFVEEAWDFVQYTMLSVEGNVRRYEMTNLFPHYIPAMDNERLHFADEYFSGQDLGGVFAEVAPGMPAQYQSPYRSEMNALLGAKWQAIYDLEETPADVFSEVANQIRDTMAAEA
jgi:ABC-type glycerol-3-phosphate transport system substrate-binding protein